VFLRQRGFKEAATLGTARLMQDHMRHLHVDLGQLNNLVCMGGRRLGKRPLPTGIGFGHDLKDLRGQQQGLAMPRMSRLRSWSPLRGRGRRLLHKRRIGRGETIGVAGILGHASFERGDPHGLLLDDGEQLDDYLAHDQGALFPTGGIQRKPYAVE
jgi:hypothetical protein